MEIILGGDSVSMTPSRARSLRKNCRVTVRLYLCLLAGGLDIGLGGEGQGVLPDTEEAQDVGHDPPGFEANALFD